MVLNRNYSKYSPTAKNRLMNVKMNAVMVHNNCQIRHEITKSVICILIHRYGDFKMDDEMIGLISQLDARIKEVFKGWIENHTDFLTEAWASEKRRVDVVNLGTNDWVEIETEDVDKGDCLTVRI